MADRLKLDYAATTALTVAGLATLANGASATSNTIDNTAAGYVEILLTVSVTTGAGAASGGTVEVYAKGSPDGTNFDDDANDAWIRTLVLPAAGAATYRKTCSVSTGFGGAVPSRVQVRIRNATGAALTAGSVTAGGVHVLSATA